MIIRRPLANFSERELRSERDGEPYTLSKDLTGEVKPGHLRVLHEVLASGRRASKPHVHSKRTEYLFALSGEGTLREGNETFPIRTGDFLEIRAGGESSHVLENFSLGPLVYLQMWIEDPEDRVKFTDA